jgi:DNA-binding beta-propeller fold protein YncE
MKNILLFFLIMPFSVFAQDALKLTPVDFFRLPAGKNFGEAVGIAVNSRQHVFVFHRGPGSLMEFDAAGNFIRSLGDGLIKKAHGLRIDPDDNIWVTDVEQHLVIKFNPEGHILMVLGKIDMAGEFNETYQMLLFNRPADVAFDGQGNVYIADGYGNSRIVKTDKNGKLLKTWGTKGSGKGEFNLPHNVVIDAKNRVYVADRENKRIQVFDSEGNYLNEWTHLGQPYGLAISGDELYMTDGVNGSVSRLSLAGKVLGKYGSPGKATGQFLMPHAVAVSAGNKLFVAETINWRVQCFNIPASR